MVKISMEERKGAADEGGSISSKSKRMRYSSDSEKDEAVDGVDELTNSEAAGGDNDDEPEEPSPEASSVILTDPGVLDCAMCYEPLTIPVFQCENGHIACSSCCTKFKNKCSSCLFPIGYNRCRAIEKVIESVKVVCQNYGCNETLDLSSRKSHEDKCIHSPVMCPVRGCHFVGSSQQLSRHLSARHSFSVKRFTYHRPLPLVLNKDCRMIMLQEETEDALFVLNNKPENNGISLTVNHLGPKRSSRVVAYGLMVEEDDHTLRLQSTMLSHFSEFATSSRFLVVSHAFFDSRRRLKIELWINKPTYDENSGI